ncbi:hypothetical protein F4703DRAFT_1168463 [Phycomyces blakesleeanus]
MSAQLARQSLNLLLKPTVKPTADNGGKAKRVEKKSPQWLPKTKIGLKKIKHEIRYGQHQKTKQKKEEEKKRENPIDALIQTEKTLDENLARNVKMLTSKLRATKVERELHKQVLKYRSTKQTKSSKEEADDESD